MRNSRRRQTGRCRLFSHKEPDALINVCKVQQINGKCWYDCVAANGNKGVGKLAEDKISFVLLDYLLARESFYDMAREVVRTCTEGNTKGCIAAHSISNMFFILRKD